DQLGDPRGPRVRRLYLVHHLGFPQDAPGWLAWCRAGGLLLVEDATQAWLGTVDDRPLGPVAAGGLFRLRGTGGWPGAALAIARPPDRGPADGAGPARRQAMALRRLLGDDPRAARRGPPRGVPAPLG